MARRKTLVAKDDAATSSDVIRQDTAEETRTGFPDDAVQLEQPEPEAEPAVAKKAPRRPRDRAALAAEKLVKVKSAPATFPNHPRSTRSAFPTHPECVRCIRRREREKDYASKARADKRALKTPASPDQPAPPSDAAPSATS